MSQPQNTPSPEGSSKNTALIGGVIVVAIAVIAGFAYGQKKPNEAPVVPTQDTVGMVPLTPPSGATNTGSMTPPVVMERSSSTTGAAMTPPPKPATDTPPKPTGSTGSTTKNSFKDGTYTANGVYKIHAGEEEIRVTVTLKNDVVTATSFEITPKFPMSKRFIDMFSENYKPLVIGKKISELNLGRVSGSSLTPVGFNNALEKIKTQAGV